MVRDLTVLLTLLYIERGERGRGKKEKRGGESERIKDKNRQILRLHLFSTMYV